MNSPAFEYAQYGRCRQEQTPVSFFFPDDRARRTTADAQAFCETCGVRVACLAYGLRTNADGVFGGFMLGGASGYRQRAFKALALANWRLAETVAGQNDNCARYNLKIQRDFLLWLMKRLR